MDSIQTTDSVLDSFPSQHIHFHDILKLVKCFLTDINVNFFFHIKYIYFSLSITRKKIALCMILVSVSVLFLVPCVTYLNRLLVSLLQTF